MSADGETAFSRELNDTLAREYADGVRLVSGRERAMRDAAVVRLTRVLGDADAARAVEAEIGARYFYDARPTYVRRVREIRAPPPGAAYEPSLIAVAPNLWCADDDGYAKTQAAIDRALTKQRLQHEIELARPARGARDGHGLVPCPKCRSTHTDYTQLQTSASDEGMTLHFECHACKHNWKVR